ncbi:ABC transporter ATP-binding protein [Paratractidigestivibacter sp.]|uniref:ABC transporter ATP-binding protein n=1 Tax=Paratractidigestivibacter sp. TaxID=2847316 RepID=UPI003A8E2E28
MLLSVRNLCTDFPVKRGTVHAVEDVSFGVDAGEILAIVGESGSGKSVTSLSIMGLLAEPGHVAAGEVELEGKNLVGLPEKEYRQLRGNDMAMIFQEPMTSLNPVYRIGNQIVEAIRTHEKVGKKEARERAIDLLRKVGIPSPEKRIDDYPHQMSGGMRQRVMIAMALACDPDILIADEPTTALDVTIQAQIIELMKEMQQKNGNAIIMITHDLGVVADVADKIMVMYAGAPVEMGTADEIFYQPHHPYTWGLMNSIPKAEVGEKRPLTPIEGNPPSLVNVPAGCSFAPRCPYATDKCRAEAPERVEVSEGHFARCHYAGDESFVAAHAPENSRNQKGAEA